MKNETITRREFIITLIMGFTTSLLSLPFLSLCKNRKINGSNTMSFKVDKATNVLQATQERFNTTTTTLPSQNGILVTALNNKSGNGWIYEVNGRWIGKSADNCPVSPGDKIEWIPA